MDARATSEAKGPDARAEALVSAYERAGYARLSPAILQPAEPFLDLSGEDIRKRMYLTSAPGGGEFCLRPDLTIPVSRDYLASPAAGQVASIAPDEVHGTSRGTAYSPSSACSAGQAARFE